ncbi:hypothetical protein P4244_11280 [Bacillus thuringiensis]|nr:hypothetical protein [Bacillus thuringiensis]
MESREIRVPFEIKQPHRAPSEQIKGYAINACEAAGRQKVDQWNDGPDGKRYEYDSVSFVTTEGDHTDTENDFFHGSKWKFNSTAVCELHYNKLD